jgi:hypothetical protein
MQYIQPREFHLTHEEKRLVGDIDTISTMILSVDYLKLEWLVDVLRKEVRNTSSPAIAIMLSDQLRRVRAIRRCRETLLAL